VRRKHAQPLTDGSCLCSVAKFLEARGLVEKALEVAKDADYRFELALQLDNVDVAVAIAEELGSETRWKQLGELALADGAQACRGSSRAVSACQALGTRSEWRAVHVSVSMRSRSIRSGSVCRSRGLLRMPPWQACVAIDDI
jgi:Coatomer WD associated region